MGLGRTRCGRRMDGLKGWLKSTIGTGLLGMASMVLAQGTPAAPATGTKPAAPAAAPAGAPLQLRSLNPMTQTDPFPAVDPKNFTADSPSVSTVDNYLRVMLGYDANRIWRVEAIQKTPVPGVAKVLALVSQKGVANSRVLSVVFYTMPDGKHLIAPDASGMNPFGSTPFAENRAILQARADGPYENSAAKDLMLVEFGDLQCPNCKAAAPVMAKLAHDFPKARIVYENFPLTEVHPQAMQAALYGVCVAKKDSASFFNYAQTVYDTQADLTADKVTATLAAAVTKAGGDPAAVATCAASPEAKATVAASVKLASDLGVGQTPMLAVNGRLIPITSVPYDILRSLITYQADLDGVTAAAAGPPVDLSVPKTPPTPPTPQP